MFGYVVVKKEEMKVKEYDTYKAVYCSLCRRMHKDYGFFSKFTLSYDFTFAALLYLSQNGGCKEFERKSCQVNPLKKCVYCKNDFQGFDRVAAMAVLLTEYKVRDNVADSSFLRSLPFRLVLPFVKGWKKKALKKFPEYQELLKNYEDGQRKAEESSEKSIDFAAEPTAILMKRFFGSLSNANKAAEYLGYCLGKWIYLLDAAEDIEDDLKENNFTPFDIKSNDPSEIERIRKEIAIPNLNVCRIEAQKAFELLDCTDFGEIIANILYLGITAKQESVLRRKEQSEKPL